MRARRLAVAAIAIAWLTPGGLAGATALHLALEHEHGELSGAGHLVEIAALLEHGHLHRESGLPHRHSAALAARDVLSRCAVKPGTFDSHTAVAQIAPRLAESACTAPTAARHGPAAESGPPLLARISTLRL